MLEMIEGEFYVLTLQNQQKGTATTKQPRAADIANLPSTKLSDPPGLNSNSLL